MTDDDLILTDSERTSRVAPTHLRCSSCGHTAKSKEFQVAQACPNCNQRGPHEAIFTDRDGNIVSRFRLTRAARR